MIHFRNDYSAGAHPAVLSALTDTNLELTAGYGADPYCEAAARTIRDLCAAPDAAVHFLVGGTQANKTVIGAFLRPYEAVIAAETAHICCHETGAVEADGHKIISVPAPDGKLTPDMIRTAVTDHTSEHMVVPRMVYISNTTELGTIYSLLELRSLRQVCDELGLYLYCDGARLGSAMTAPGSNVGFAVYAALCDAFTIGGTKNGLLFGEAVVIANVALQPGFRHYMKRQGAILAKGRLLGVQFSALLEGGLFLELASHANRLALHLTQGLSALNVPLLVASPSNQVFPILPDAVVEELGKDFTFELQQRVDEGHTCIRLVTSWVSNELDVEEFLRRLEELL